MSKITDHLAQVEAAQTLALAQSALSDLIKKSDNYLAKIYMRETIDRLGNIITALPIE